MISRLELISYAVFAKRWFPLLMREMQSIQVFTQHQSLPSTRKITLLVTFYAHGFYNLHMSHFPATKCPIPLSGKLNPTQRHLKAWHLTLILFLISQFELRVQTDGTITPRAALMQCCKDLVNDLSILNREFIKEYELRKMVGDGAKADEKKDDKRPARWWKKFPEGAASCIVRMVFWWLW